MSYYSNNPLTFPSYNQSQIPQRNVSALSGVSGLAKEAQLNSNRNSHQINTQAHHGTLPLPQRQQQHQHQHQNTANVMNSGSALPPPVNSNSEIKPPRKERKNRPGQKFGAKKKSWVWSWFVQDLNDPNIAACDFCGKIITRLASDKGSPKKLSEHLKTHKLSKDSINSSRPIPIDGNGITYAPNGVPLNFPNHFNSNNAPNSPPNPSSERGLSAPPPPNDNVESNKRKKTSATPQSNYNLNDNRRFLSTEFDNSPYSSMKFHRHLLKFLTENKLAINVIKSHSFQQLIYDLRSDSVTELLELTGLYSSLLEVSRFESSNPDSSSMPTIDEASVANTIAQAVEQKANGNVN